MKALPVQFVTVCALLAATACGQPGDSPADSGPRGDAGVGDDPPVVRYDQFEILADPLAPARRSIGRVRLQSSRAVEPVEGRDNHDWDNYLDHAGDRYTLLREPGPGVVTRIWLTMKNAMGADVLFTADPVLHVDVDGAEAFEGGVQELTAGDIDSFPTPWVAGPVAASGGFCVTVPIHFQTAIEIWLEKPADLSIYYQVDWRSLPADTLVTSFSGSLSAEQRADLDDATTLWTNPTGELGMPIEVRAHLDPTDSIVAADVPAGVIRKTEIIGPLDAIRLAVLADGVSVADDLASRLLGAPGEVQPYASALLDRTSTGASLGYPAPIRTDGHVTLTNASTVPIDIAARVFFEPGSIDFAAYGALRITCGEAVAALAANVTVADLSGPGHYAGQSLRMAASMYGFVMLEGDHEVIVDDDWILGTGVEDFFGAAHYFIGGTFALPYVGMTSPIDPRSGAPVIVMYRHFLGNAIPFDRHLSFQYEGWVEGTGFSGCSYWYSFQAAE